MKAPPVSDVRVEADPQALKAASGFSGASIMPLLAIVVLFFALQMLASRWWLGRHAYGPAEWVWRAFAYGERPAMKSR